MQFRSMAQKSGCAFGFVGSGNDTRSTVTCPMIPFSYRMSPIDWQMVMRFIFGNDYCGKKQLEFTCNCAFTRSIDPTIYVLPSGSIKKAMLGLAICYLRHVGAASIIPPTRQNAAIYSAQVL